MKVIATDLDGTLLAGNTELSDENLNAIKRLYYKGIKTVVVTGRTFYEIPLALRESDFVEYLIYSNGAGVYKKGMGNLFYSTINKKTAKEIFDLLNSYETFIELYSSGKPLVDEKKFSEKGFDYYRISPDFIPEMRRSRIPAADFNKNFDENSEFLEMFDVFFREQTQRAECREKLLSLYPQLEFTTSMDNNLEIMNRGINKGSGIIKFCEIENIDINDVIALGDSKNDLTLFKAVKTSFAVSNACKELKAVSSKVICSNDDNVICYMEKYFEGKEY
ncbi:MAG: HAD family hydrolase [Clostridiales bacterium]|nr:HAD family hydrolase [Clostridiales bacterium]